MKFYLAPMEGVTGYIYRNAYHDFFHPMDKYFTPFIVPKSLHKQNNKEIKDILPENNTAAPIIPQLLTNNAVDFINMAKGLKAMGYTEINLNLGCPSGTVVAKGKGAGFLAEPLELDNFLYKIFSELGDMKLSVKTRLGMDSPDEFEDLLNIYNRYAIEELIIHPRVRKDMYKNTPNMEAFGYAMELSKNTVIYNGDIFSVAAYDCLIDKFPQVQGVMLGRGIIANPGLLDEICLGAEARAEMSCTNEPLAKEKLRAFHDRLLNDYSKIMSGDRNLLFRMKELWNYMGGLFPDGGKLLKKIKKAERLADYMAAVDGLFSL